MNQIYHHTSITSIHLEFEQYNPSKSCYCHFLYFLFTKLFQCELKTQPYAWHFLAFAITALSEHQPTAHSCMLHKQGVSGELIF